MPSDNRKIEPVVLPEATESLRRVVYQAVGEASMCWVPIPEGVFDDTSASRVAEELLAKIQAITDWSKPKLGLATNDELHAEIEARERLVKYGLDFGQGALEPALPLWHLVAEPWVGKEELWRHRDTPTIYSTDRGETYYDLNEELDPEGNPRIHKIGDASA